MPSRRSYLASLCSGTLLLGGCSSGPPNDDENAGGQQSGVRHPVTPTPEESDEPPEETTESDIPPESERLDIRDFGAEIDGTTNDTQAIRDAIASADDGDTVYFPAGTTVVSADVENGRTAIPLDSEAVPQNLQLTGEGRESVIRMGDGQDPSHTVLRFTGRGEFGGLVIQQLQIDGNKEAQTGTSGHGIMAFNEEGAMTPANVRIEGLWVTNCSQSGISLYRGGFVVERCTVTDCTIHGVNIGNGAEWDENLPPVVVRQCLCTENGKSNPGGTYGINCSGGNILVEDCVCANNGQGSKTTDGSINVTYRRVRLQNNDFFGYIRAGEETSRRSKVTFDRVVASNNGEGGFRFSRDTDYRIPTEIVATGNGNHNIIITKNATIEAQRIWANRANGSYGIRENSISGGHIREYYHYDNQSGALDGGDNLDISAIESQDKTDIESVPTILEVGAHTHWMENNGRGVVRPR